jgi:hypothetical protein
MSNEVKVIEKSKLPSELTSLPIFKVLGEQISTTVKKPETQKTIASAFFWAILIGGSAWFFYNIDTILQTLETAFKTVVWGISFIVLLMLAPKIISLLHTMGRTMLFKTEKGFIRRNPISTLQLLLEDAKDTLKRVKEKISNVDGVRINMITDAQAAKDEAEAKYNHLAALTRKAAEMDAEAENYAKNGLQEKANAAKREANELRVAATLRKQEGEASETTGRQYAQYANQFSKVLEVLKDNESAARIYVNALGSSITIIDKKMEATSKMKNATEGMADVFNIKDGWKFQEAMGAATEAISQNIASIRSNLEFLDENKSVNMGSQASQEELEQFINKVNNGKLQTLNVAEISDASYDLRPEQKVDKGFNLLD